MIFDFKTYKEESLGASNLTQDDVMGLLNAACIRLNAKREEPLAVNMVVAKHIQECVALLRRIFSDSKIKYELDETRGFRVTLRMLDMGFSYKQGPSSDFKRIYEISNGVSTFTTGQLDHACVLIRFDFALCSRKVRIL